ncbi:hypothetical protein LJB42_001902 [Komagataella kurtzmanii]|nr:hypothetical protein LJB42_001902 [Komagataella kurtzmanii]
MFRQGLGLVRPFSRTTSPALNRVAQYQLIRNVSTVKASHDEEQEILVAQRKVRPSSPHLTIYAPQLTWILSSFHRITGVGLAGGFYALTCGYAAANLLGYDFTSADIVGLYSQLPEYLKYSVKAIAAYPFVFHISNGLRHLVWDFGKELTIPGVYRTGYAVLASTALVATGLLFL